MARSPAPARPRRPAAGAPPARLAGRTRGRDQDRRTGRQAGRARRSALRHPRRMPPRTFEVRRRDRNDRDDVRGADPRMRPFVPPQVDPLTRHLDRRDQPADERGLLADDRENRPVVVGVRVHVEQPACSDSARPIASIVSASRPSEKFGTDSSGSTLRTLERSEGVLPRSGAGVRRLVAPARSVRAAERPCLAGRARRGACRDRTRCRQGQRSTSPVAPASSRVTSPARSRASTRATRCSPSPPSRRRRRLTSRATHSTCRSWTAPSSGCSRATSTAISRKATASVSSTKPAASPPSSSCSTPALHDGEPRFEWQERLLKDGSRWEVYKRFFTGRQLLEELGGGDVLFEGRWFVLVRA